MGANSWPVKSLILDGNMKFITCPTSFREAFEMDPETRSRMMSGIGTKDTGPEMVVRRYLHQEGFRYRLHCRDLPGRPDLVLTKWQSVIFVHGCFWHGHHGCKYFRFPKSRADFWHAKITANAERDRRAEDALKNLGWRVFVVWECSLRDDPSESLRMLKQLLASKSKDGEISSFHPASQPRRQE